ncbi:MAG: hypothetical protein QGH40_05780 [bacterium]|jgi:hypothetical protein|nr:hypothetical protein [bacterium]
MNDSRKTKAQLIAEKKETSLRLKQAEKELNLAREHLGKGIRVRTHQLTETGNRHQGYINCSTETKKDEKEITRIIHESS